MAATKTVTKTAAKNGKSARKSANKKSDASARRAVKKYDPSAKIAVVRGFENPKREGGMKHAAFELLRKFSGKTVAAFLEAGGRAWALASAERRKLAKVG